MSRGIMDVIVIGCGASGVAALARLHEAGLQALGLEAADRIGGRVCSVEYGDCVVDLGAAWCHGETDNVVFELANPHNLLGHSAPTNDHFVQSNGESVPNDVAREIIHAIETVVNNADKSSQSTISDCLRSGIKSSTILHKHSALVNSFVEWYERNNHLGGQRDADTGKSLRGLQENQPCPGDFMMNWKGEGFKTILDVLLKKIPDPSKEIPVKIFTNKEVETIRWKANQPGLDSENPLVHVKCRDGSLYAAKRVIVTLSIGVLKERHSQLFNPPLPAEKVNSINNLQMCVLDKIYIEFERPWWSHTRDNFTILWRQEDKDKFSSQEQWITEIYGLWTVENQPNVLLAWIYGEGAKTMEENSLENVKIGVEKLLRVLFEKNFKMAPVKSILRSQWYSNPLTRGAYSYRSACTERNDANAESLGSPIRHATGAPVLCFAGEGTSPQRWGSVHGAVEAGLREADRIIQSFK